ncbi:hypothetical protein EV356DRAFT_530507 [Viridothelium virens]|uniref:Rhodopsin domain-containing protein n=1 Tax=Viridothelium virens TaxID=1048519 RepID=A0A6A6HGM9_VIRVR|nr:hypothetical protein EV356DRAFT_530507 [Viridothelium virens]
MAEPMGPPPPGGNQDRGPAILAIWWTEVGVSAIVLLLRLQSRLILRKIGVDDWIMFFTWLLFAVCSIITTLLCRSGGARHLYYLSPSQLSTAVRWNWIAIPFGIAAIATGKISTAFLVLRIMGRNGFWRKWFLYFGSAFTAAVSTIAITLTFAQCSPSRALWNPTLPGAHCWDPRVNTDFSIFTAAWNAFFDLALALMPITIIWNLQMKLERKVALCTVLGLGVFASVSSAVKASKLNELNARADITWETYELYVWTSAEIFVIIVLGSVPTLRPVFERFILKPKSSYARPSKTSYQRDLESSGLSGSTRVGGDSQTHPKSATKDSRLDTDRGDSELARLTSIRMQQTFEVSSFVYDGHSEDLR